MTLPARVLITGASSGIGEALAAEMAARGAAVWLGARRTERLDGVVATIRQAGGTAEAVALDVSDALACAETITALDAAVGGFDCVVANAGVGGKETSIWKTDVVDMKQVLDTNLTGALATILPLLTLMRARGGGHVVGISSLAADMAQPFAPVYGASKAGLSFFLDSIQPELKKAKIAVTIVHPGFVKSEITDAKKFDMPFILESRDAAKIIANGIEHRDHWVRFPRPLSVAMSVAKLLPRSVQVAIVNRGGGGDVAGDAS